MSGWLQTYCRIRMKMTETIVLTAKALIKNLLLKFVVAETTKDLPMIHFPSLPQYNTMIAGQVAILNKDNVSQQLNLAM